MKNLRFDRGQQSDTDINLNPFCLFFIKAVKNFTNLKPDAQCKESLNILCGVRSTEAPNPQAKRAVVLKQRSH